MHLVRTRNSVSYGEKSLMLPAALVDAWAPNRKVRFVAEYHLKKQHWDIIIAALSHFFTLRTALCLF